MVKPTVGNIVLYMGLAFVLLMAPLSAFGQHVQTRDGQPMCGKPPCIFVHVDAVSYYGSKSSKD